MKRIAMIIPFVLAASLSLHAAPAQKPAAKWYVAQTAHVLYGPFRKEATAINFCMRQRTNDCKVIALVSPTK